MPATYQEIYELAIAQGATHRFADMLASRQAPGAVSDREFCAGRGTLDKQFQGAPEMLEYVVREAKRQGYTPCYTDIYDPNLAQSIGDPEAFIPAGSGEARGHVKRVCEQRGWSCHGAVEVKGREPERDPRESKPHLGDDIVAALAPEVVQRDPKLARSKRPKQAIREAVEHFHAAT